MFDRFVSHLPIIAHLCKRSSFDLDDEQYKLLGISKDEDIEIDFGDAKEEIDRTFKEFMDRLSANIPKMTKKIASSLLSKLREDAPAMLKVRRSDYKKFEKRLYNDWGKPFDLYEMFLVLAYEAGAEFNNEFRMDKEEKNYFLLEALTRLHARACQIASEILVLIKSGYADGAHARWRSLHEVAVVSSFLKKHGNEVAERYLLHENIESFKIVNLHQKYYEALGDSPVPLDEYNRVKSVYEELIARFGASYRHEYGWASSALNNEKPNFSDIEEDSGLDLYRPYYKLASHNVHANPKGLMFKLGLIPEGEDFLLAGPTNTGFTDPAQGAVFSLRSITIGLITSKPVLDNLVLDEILWRLESEIAKEFLKVQKKIEKRERQYRNKKEKIKKTRNIKPISKERK